MEISYIINGIGLFISTFVFSKLTRELDMGFAVALADYNLHLYAQSDTLIALNVIAAIGFSVTPLFHYWQCFINLREKHNDSFK
jgi:hypothetical protein